MAKPDAPPTTPTEALTSIVGALPDDEIRERLSVLGSDGFPPDDCIYFAEYLAKCCRGDVIEEAIRTLVENFPDDRLPELVRKHVAPTLSPGVDYCAGVRSSTLGYVLTNLGFDVRSRLASRLASGRAS